jgi:hypothetical protein
MAPSLELTLHGAMRGGGFHRFYPPLRRRVEVSAGLQAVEVLVAEALGIGFE